MENDFCQNHLYHNYNMLITYFIKEVDYGSRMKSCLQDTWKGRRSLTRPPVPPGLPLRPPHAPPPSHSGPPSPPLPVFPSSSSSPAPVRCHQQWPDVSIFKLISHQDARSQGYSMVQVSREWPLKGHCEALWFFSFMVFFNLNFIAY